MLEELQKLFIRDLEKLKTEISAYKDEDKIWATRGKISNSAGNLCLHIVGNLNHFIGAVLIDTGYIRDREGEFQNKNISRSTLIAMIDGVISLFQDRFLEIEPGVLHVNFPVKVFDYDMTTSYFLIHLSGHLNYHLGQVNYHRRLIDPD